MANANLHAAKSAKNDEFYTQLSDIEKELKHYKKFFKDKIVYCNCDNPQKSEFCNFFRLKFVDWGLKKLIVTCITEDKSNGKAYIWDRDINGNGIMDDDEVEVFDLDYDGSFDCPQCIEYLDECDIVVTNPPFSLFREYVKLLVDHNKKFLIIGNNNAITYKEIFPLIKDNKLWLGLTWVKDFIQPDKSLKTFGNISWFTNLPHGKRHEELALYKTYNPTDYPKYDNYDAIEVKKVADIPYDYTGVMGVPITFLTDYCPDQFEILGLANDKRDTDATFIKGTPYNLDDKHKKFVGMVFKGKATYARILIRFK